MENIDGQLMIRARQGHSMKDVESEQLLDKLTDAWKYPVVVHGTYREPMPLIMDGGLNRMTRKHLHMAVGMPGKGVISGMRATCEVVIEINLAKAMYGPHKIDFFVSGNDV